MKTDRLKSFVKNALGNIKCRRNGISLKKGTRVYIGKGANIKGGKNIDLGNGVCIRPNVSLWCGNGVIEIGAGTEIGERDRISISNKLTIGEKVLISPNVYITDCDHRYDKIGTPVIEQGIIDKDNKVVIKEHSYIGINSVIVGNVTIGKGCVIGANSVVTKDIPDYCVAVGIPAQIIKKYNFESGVWERNSVK